MSGKEKFLNVYLSGIHCGKLFEAKNGALSFEYDTFYSGVPLSVSMPIGVSRYENRTVRSFLLGLLPDDLGTRSAIGLPYGVSGENPFRLLKIIGLDCPGAVQVLESEKGDLREEAPEDLKELSDNDIEQKLYNVRKSAASAWTKSSPSEGHWSLAGCQAKFALRKKDNRWFECLGPAATSHILKPGVAGFDQQALVEYLSMQIAAEIKLSVAKVEYQLFGDEPAIVVERYDRDVFSDGSIRRIHQEDFCQALSINPISKYAEDGGPSTPQIVKLLKKTGKASRDNIYVFLLYLFFNYLIGATDSHAKNFSLLLRSEDDIRLAPLYDVASMAPYRSLAPERHRPLRAALSIGGENRFGRVGVQQIEKMVSNCALETYGLTVDLLTKRMASMAEVIPPATESVVERAVSQGVSGAAEVGAKMVKEISAHCGRTLAQL